MPNRLGNAASPYLRSHAGNPVDWWPWGDEPFAEARARDIPVMVSIGYSTCHWCHVMARESFSDPETAALLNEHFVAIKVDREEHAEVDAAYLAAASAFTQNLGWPLTVFVTPQGRAFFAGTYWPPVESHGRPAFRDVLAAVLDAWTQRRDSVDATAEELAAALAVPQPRLEASIDLAGVVAALEAEEDREFGGFGRGPGPVGPKFPVSPVVNFLLSIEAPLGDRVLDATAGLRDPVDGGFFRYATLRDWTEPHYERMLYDNAQLLGAFALAGRHDAAGGIADFLLTTLREPGGAFWSAQDSESIVDGQRVEGAYFQLDAAGRATAQPPAIDDKLLTGWNGLAIESLARAGGALHRPDLVDAAATAARRILALHRLPDRLARASVDGVISDAPATLEDVGDFANGLLALAIATGDAHWAVTARELVESAITPDGGFAMPGDPVLAAQGIVVGMDPTDGALPSGPSAMAKACHTLYLLTAESRYRDAAQRQVASVAGLAVQQPLGFGTALEVAAAFRRRCASSWWCRRTHDAPTRGSRAHDATGRRDDRVGRDLRAGSGLRRRGLRAVRRQVLDRRPSDRVRVHRLRLPAARDGCRSTATSSRRRRDSARVASKT